MTSQLIATAQKLYKDLYLKQKKRNEENESGSQLIPTGYQQDNNDKESEYPQQTLPYKVYADFGKPNIDIHNENIISPESVKGFSHNNQKGNSYTLSAKSRSVSKIPDSKLLTTTTNWEPINLRNIDEEYHLYGLAYAKIYYEPNVDSIVYTILEPELDQKEKSALDKLKRGFVYVFDKSAPKFETTDDQEVISKGARSLLKRYKMTLSEEGFKKVIYYLGRDFLGLEQIEPLMHDPFIEDISCDGLNTPIFINHMKYGAVGVNRLYVDSTSLNSFIVKLAQKSSQEVSLAKPILQGALQDGSRIEAIYGKEISSKGSSFTIRKFRTEPFTPIHLLELGTMPSLLLAYLWIAVENKQSILVSGGTATGKTTILNALSLFAPPSSKLVSIEDTPEINLPHEHWLPMISRENEGKAQITMFDLLKASLRERPDYIIVGEIRGKEANILFQGMASGHAGFGTVHAQKFEDLVNRMTIEPINLPKPLLTEVDIILFQKTTNVGSNIVRRTSSVVEIIEYLQESDSFNINEFMKYRDSEDKFSFGDESAVLSYLLEIKGGSEENLWNEIERRKRTLDLMLEYGILEFKYVNRVIRYYYKNPSSIFEFIKELKQSKDYS
ncbi:MAG: type II/IV secretion system ATPase subunit [Candidatus Nanoarchaeia archaeon]